MAESPNRDPRNLACRELMVRKMHEQADPEQVARDKAKMGWDELAWDLGNSIVVDARYNGFAHEVTVSMTEYPWSEGPGDGYLVGFFQGGRLDLLVGHYDTMTNVVWERDWKEYL